MLRSISHCVARLKGTKRIDLYECARVDKDVPIEETVKAIANCVESGEIDFIGLSEARAETLRRAHAVRFPSFFLVGMFMHLGGPSNCSD